MAEDPTTEELRIAQIRRESAERERAGHAEEEDATEQHQRRAERAAYLKEKLAERAESERAASEEDRPG